MKIRYKTLFYIVILIHVCIFVALNMIVGPRLERADDGTPCYVYFFSMECNYE